MQVFTKYPTLSKRRETFKRCEMCTEVQKGCNKYSKCELNKLLNTRIIDGSTVVEKRYEEATISRIK